MNNCLIGPEVHEASRYAHTITMIDSETKLICDSRELAEQARKAIIDYFDGEEFYAITIDDTTLILREV